MQSSYKAQALLALIIATALAPFVNKAFYVDDPLFIWMAQQIVRHPLDPYGFHLNWSSFIQPMSEVMQNPPLLLILHCSHRLDLWLERNLTSHRLPFLGDDVDSGNLRSRPTLLRARGASSGEPVVAGASSSR